MMRNLGDIYNIIHKGTGNRELDNEIEIYISMLSSIKKSIIKYYWYGENKRTVKYQFNIKYSDYIKISDKLIKDVNNIIDKYYDKRNKTIERANKRQNNIIDLMSYGNMRKNNIGGVM